VVWPIGQTAAVAFSPDNRKLVVGGPSSIRFFDVGTWRESATMPRRPVSPMMPAFAFSHDSRVCAAVLPPDRLVLIDAASGEELASMPANQSVFARLAFSPDDRLLAVASVDHHVLIWDIAELRGELRRLGLDWERPSGAAQR
jgi:WD40 repeat protein